MNLIKPVRRALADQNYETPTPIQAETIPPAISGKDILGCAQTGTGKTAAFALPILNHLGKHRPERRPKCPTTLMLAPTRELANQIGQSLRVYGRHLSLRQAIVYGGVSQVRQVKAVRYGVDLMVATPGRLLDLIEQKHIKLGNVQFFVLDEADRMLDMGFLPELEKIIGMLPQERQSLFFSATLPAKISELANTLLNKPVSVTVAPKKEKIGHIEQKLYRVDQAGKMPMLLDLLKQDDVDRTIVFTRTKRGADRVTKKLNTQGVMASAIHGDKTQNARERALKSFAKKRVSVLVATDVASRGIDIRGITHVVNFDVPDDAETYVHRIGRTGRAGRDGIAITFCSPMEKSKVRAIERLTGKDLLGEKDKPQKRKKKKPRNRSNAETRNQKSSGKRPNSNKSRPNSSKSRRPKRFFGKKKKPKNKQKREATAV